MGTQALRRHPSSSKIGQRPSAALPPPAPPPPPTSPPAKTCTTAGQRTHHLPGREGGGLEVIWPPAFELCSKTVYFLSIEKWKACLCGMLALGKVRCFLQPLGYQRFKPREVLTKKKGAHAPTLQVPGLFSFAKKDDCCLKSSPEACWFMRCWGVDIPVGQGHEIPRVEKQQLYPKDATCTKSNAKSGKPDPGTSSCCCRFFSGKSAKFPLKWHKTPLPPPPPKMAHQFLEHVPCGFLAVEMEPQNDRLFSFGFPFPPKTQQKKRKQKSPENKTTASREHPKITPPSSAPPSQAQGLQTASWSDLPKRWCSSRVQ